MLESQLLYLEDAHAEQRESLAQEASPSGGDGACGMHSFTPTPCAAEHFPFPKHRVLYNIHPNTVSSCVHPLSEASAKRVHALAFSKQGLLTSHHRLHCRPDLVPSPTPTIWPRVIVYTTHSQGAAAADGDNTQSNSAVDSSDGGLAGAVEKHDACSDSGAGGGAAGDGSGAGDRDADGSGSAGGGGGGGKSKAQKRREKKDREDRERAQRIADAKPEAS
jgi:hypothetical protein